MMTRRSGAAARRGVGAGRAPPGLAERFPCPQARHGPATRLGPASRAASDPRAVRPGTRPAFRPGSRRPSRCAGRVGQAHPGLLRLTTTARRPGDPRRRRRRRRSEAGEEVDGGDADDGDEEDEEEREREPGARGRASERTAAPRRQAPVAVHGTHLADNSDPGAARMRAAREREGYARAPRPGCAHGTGRGRRRPHARTIARLRPAGVRRPPDG